MKRFLAISALIVSSVLTGCQEKKPDLNSSASVCMQAEAYYQNLVAGKYKEYVEGISGSGSMLPEQKEQMLEALRKFVSIQNEAHGGVAAVQSVEAILQNGRAEVYMDIIYSDSIIERVVIPMVLEDSVWRME